MNKDWRRTFLVVAMLLFVGISNVANGGPVEDTSDGVGVPETATTVEISNATLDQPRFITTAVWTGDYVYIFGGYVPNLGIERIQRYDPVTDTIITMNATLLGTRYWIGHVWTGDVFYLFGGLYSPFNITQEIARYNPTTDVLTTLDVTLPADRIGAASFWDGRYAYLVGGNGHDDILRFDPITETIVTLPPTLPSNRYQAASVWTGEELYIFGGRIGILSTNDIIRYNPSNGSVVTMNATFPEPILMTSAIWTGRYAYILGGVTGTSPSTVNDTIFRYDPQSDTLTLLNDTLPTPRYATGAAYDGEVAYITGGNANPPFLDQIVLFDPEDPVTNTSVNIGWNLFSVPTLAQGDPAIVLNDRLGDGLTWWDRLFALSGNNWLLRDTARPAFMNTLDYVDFTMGIWMNVTQAGDGILSITGSRVVGETINLQLGWNLVGFPTDQPYQVSVALNGVPWIHVVAGNSLITPYNLDPLNGADWMVPGAGYWVFVTAAATWALP